MRSDLPVLVDMFCCQGGAARGYQRAGFYVIGVDILPQRHYAGDEFHQLDVHQIHPSWYAARGVAAIHASPECQGYTAMRHAKGAVGRPRDIPRVRAMLEATGLPYVIENVEEAAVDMPGAITLCGSMFGLGARGHRLQRHRLFTANFPISPPGPCAHDESVPVVGIFGGHARNRSTKHGGRKTKDDWGADGHHPVAAEAMGMPWATLAGMSEAIPPAYTEHLGRQLLHHLHHHRSAA